MLDLLISIFTLIYFISTSKNQDSVYLISKIFLITHITIHILFIIIPYIYLLFCSIKNKTNNNSHTNTHPNTHTHINTHTNTNTNTYNQQIQQHQNQTITITFWKLQKYYIKFEIMSNIAIPLYFYTLLTLNLINLYYLIVYLFNWNNYTFLYITFCIINNSINRIIYYCKYRYDLSIIFSIEIYKYFCIVITGILFTISINQQKLNVIFMGIIWSYLLHNSKYSLPKYIVYYGGLFLDMILLIIAIIVIKKSINQTKNINKQNNQLIMLILSSTFFMVLFTIQIYGYLRLCMQLRNSSTMEEFKYGGNSKIQTLAEFYLILRNKQQKQKQKQKQMQKQKQKQNNKNLQKQDKNSKQISQNNLQIQNPQQFQNKIKQKYQKNCEEEHICSICLQKRKHIKTNKGYHQEIQLYCKHSYHLQCLQEWILICQNKTCPLCRANLFDNLHKAQLV